MCQIAIAAITDFILSVLPTLFLWNVKIHWKIKVGVCGIMAVGFAYVFRENIFLAIHLAYIRTGVVDLPLPELSWFLA